MLRVTCAVCRSFAGVAVSFSQVLLSRACRVCRSRRRARRPCRFLRRCNEPFPDRLLAGEFPGAAYSLRLFPGCPLRRFLIETPLFHLSKDALALHFLFQNTERLVDIVVSNQYLQGQFPFGQEGTLRCGGKSGALSTTPNARHKVRLVITGQASTFSKQARSSKSGHDRNCFSDAATGADLWLLSICPGPRVSNKPRCF